MMSKNKNSLFKQNFRGFNKFDAVIQNSWLNYFFKIVYDNYSIGEIL